MYTASEVIFYRRSDGTLVAATVLGPGGQFVVQEGAHVMRRNAPIFILFWSLCGSWSFAGATPWLHSIFQVENTVQEPPAVHTAKYCWLLHTVVNQGGFPQQKQSTYMDILPN